MTTRQLGQLADSFTVGGDTWLVRAYGESGGVGVAVEAAVGLRGGQVQVINWERLGTAGDPGLVGLGRRPDPDARCRSRPVSQKTVSPLHLEWTPGYVRAVNIVTGQTAEAESVAGLGADPERPQAGAGRHRPQPHLPEDRCACRAPPPPTCAASWASRSAQLFPLPADQLSFDFLRTDDQTPDGWLTLVGAIRSADLKQVRAEMKQAGLTPSRVLPISLAAAAVAARTGRADGLVVERGRAGLAFDVVQGGVLRFRRVAPADSDPELGGGEDAGGGAGGGPADHHGRRRGPAGRRPQPGHGAERAARGAAVRL